MNKCFITKLPSSVDNDNLPILGQFKIKWLQQSNLPSNDSRGITITTNDKITIKVSGAHFTDSTMTNNLGNIKTITPDNSEFLYISNDADAILTIDNKYSIGDIILGKPGSVGWNNRPCYFDINDIKYSTDISNIYALFTNTSGDISALSNLTNLTDLNIAYTQVSGDISALSNLTKLCRIDLSKTQVSGDISALSNLTNLTNIYLPATQVSGDISALSNLTNLTTLNIGYNQISGDVDNLANLTKLNNLGGIAGTSLSGDMSKIPANINFISQADRKINTNFTWTAKGRQNATLLAMSGDIPFDTASMDNMFIDQATCTFKPTNSGSRIISVSGTRTSASDAAVTAIQNMGVTITGVTKQA